MKRVSIIVLASILMSPLCFPQEPGPSSERLTLKDEYVLLVKDLANMGTYGYRCHLSERDNTGRAAPQQYQGALEATGSSTDIAINGKGFFRMAPQRWRTTWFHSWNMTMACKPEAWRKDDRTATARGRREDPGHPTR